MGFFQRKVRFFSLTIPLLVFLAFFSLSTVGARRAPWYEEALWNLVTPAQSLFTALERSVTGVWHGYVGLVGVRSENETLKKRLAGLEWELVRATEFEKENKRLRDILSYRDSFKFKFVVARVIASDTRAEFKSVTVNKGSNDGIEPLMPVVGPRGLVGKVGKVASGYSRVLLITDPNSAVDVFVQRSRTRGVIVGQARRVSLRPEFYLTRLEYLTRTSDVNEGDVVVTSGLDGVFPAGIPVGTVHEVSKARYGIFLDANVVPYENMVELSEVAVMMVRLDDANVSGSDVLKE